nr:LOW QUALITY PROTEIN: DNA-directed RNA polymerase III subunit RPC6 [Aegilops tauschii subsp. strangulata]
MPPRKRPLEPSSGMPAPPDVKPLISPASKSTSAPAPAPAPAPASAPEILPASILNNLPGPEREVYKRIYEAGNKGMWSQDIRYAMKLAAPTLTKLTRALVQRGILKEVTDVRHRGKKVFMDARIEPSPEITGGTWYHNGQLDTDAVAAVRRRCLDQIDRLGAATPDMVHKGVEREDPRAGYAIDQIRDILQTMALDRVLEECRSTGEGEFSAVRAGRVCYRRGGAPQGGMIEGIPCGVCPRIDECSPDGVISPTTCVYYKKWLQMDF